MKVDKYSALAAFSFGGMVLNLACVVRVQVDFLVASAALAAAVCGAVFVLFFIAAMRGNDDKESK